LDPELEVMVPDPLEEDALLASRSGEEEVDNVNPTILDVSTEDTTRAAAEEARHRHKDSIYTAPLLASPYVQTVSHLNWLAALPSYMKVELRWRGPNGISVSDHHNVKEGAIYCT
jgi:hypothetical protein